MFLVELQNTLVSTANNTISGVNQCGLCLTPFQSEFLSPNCQMYFFELKMFLVEMKNTFISALSVWSLPNTRALPITILVSNFCQMYFFVLPNVFVWIAKCIWLNCKKVLSVWSPSNTRPFQSQFLSPNVFVWIGKCIYSNCKMYLFELLYVFVWSPPNTRALPIRILQIGVLVCIAKYIRLKCKRYHFWCKLT